MKTVNTDSSFTELLNQSVDDLDARGQLYERVYDELRNVARRQLRNQPREELQTTALVNEVIVRIENSEGLKKIANRKVFFSVATQAMVHVLIDQCRRRKRRVATSSLCEPLDAVIQQVEDDSQFDFELLAMELERLKRDDPRQHAVIMHRYFGGLSLVETAKILAVAPGTVERDWRLARAKLFLRLRDTSPVGLA